MQKDGLHASVSRSLSMNRVIVRAVSFDDNKNHISNEANGGIISNFHWSFELYLFLPAAFRIHG